MPIADLMAKAQQITAATTTSLYPDTVIVVTPVDAIAGGGPTRTDGVTRTLACMVERASKTQDGRWLERAERAVGAQLFLLHFPVDPTITSVLTKVIVAKAGTITLTQRPVMMTDGCADPPVGGNLDWTVSATWMGDYDVLAADPGTRTAGDTGPIDTQPPTALNSAFSVAVGSYLATDGTTVTYDGTGSPVVLPPDQTAYVWLDTTGNLIVTK